MTTVASRIRRRPPSGTPLRLALRAGAAAAILGVCALLGHLTDFDGRLSPLAGPNAPIYDLAVGLLAESDAAKAWPNTVVLLIDEASLQAEPLSKAPRALFHPHLGQIARTALELGARRVGLDFVVALDPADLDIAGADLKAYDRDFRATLEANPGRIVLGAYPSVQPAAAYAEIVGPTGVGVVDLQQEADGVVRSTSARVWLPEGRIALSFNYLMAAPVDGSISVPNEPRFLLFPRAPLASAPAMSVLRFERCAASPEGRAALARALAGRNLLVGTGVSGEDLRRGPDQFVRTPVAAGGAPAAGPDCAPRPYLADGAGQLVPGVLLQAAAMESALSERTPQLAEAGTRAAGNAAVGALALALFALATRRVGVLPSRRPRLFGTTLRAVLPVTAALVGLALVVVLLAAGLIRFAGLWLPVGHTLLFASGFGLVGAFAVAVRQDLALADLRAAFGRYLPEPVVEAALRPDKSAVFEGEERTITVLMADLKGFTAFCGEHRAHPTDIIAGLNRKFAAAQTVLDRFEACLDKFDGDAAIAFWNGIGEQPDHAARAIAAAMQIIEDDRAAVVASGGEEPLTFKVAVATGVAFVGNYGSWQKKAFSAIGEPMNLAARLEKLCGDHAIEIAIAQSTVEALAATPATSPAAAVLARHDIARVGSAVVKGFAEPVPFYTARPKARSEPVAADSVPGTTHAPALSRLA